jgi:uncharacterized protein
MDHAAMAAGPLSLAAALVAGFAGSGHCAAMCGGIAGALGMRARQLARSAPRALAQATAQQGGRIAAYAAAGATCGGLGGALASLADLASLARALRVAAGIYLIALAVRVATGRGGFRAIERIGGRFWGRAARLAGGAQARGLGGALLLGALWGFMPCGLVYSMLVYAALAGGAWHGAAVMAAFGLGTLPAVLGGSLFSAQFWRAAQARGLNAAAGGLLMLFGVLTALAPLLPMHH